MTPKTTKLVRSSKSKIAKEESSENVPYLEVNELLLMHYNIANNNYQQTSKILYTFITKKSLG